MSEWISIKDKIPEKDGRYLVFEKGNYYGWVGVLSLREGRWDSENVSHWMPLPESPHE